MQVAAILFGGDTFGSDARRCQRPALASSFHRHRLPFFAHMAGVQGTVKLELSIDQSGAVSSAKSVSGPPILAAPTIDALKKWSFSPCTSGDCLFPLTIRFVLEGGPLYVNECKTKFSFDSPNLATIQTEHARGTPPWRRVSEMPQHREASLFRAPNRPKTKKSVFFTRTQFPRPREKIKVIKRT